MGHRPAWTAACVLSALVLNGAGGDDGAPERGFRDETPIVVDLDGDGRVDAIRPHTFEFRRWKIPGVPPAPDGRVESFVVLDLETAAGRRLGSFYRFRFGTENGGYESYTLRLAGDLDGDGQADLLFRVGGRLPEEGVVLLDRKSSFLARTTGPLRCACRLTRELVIVGGAEPEEEWARWDPERARFAGPGVVWVIGSVGRVRERPDPRAPVLLEVPGGVALHREERRPGEGGASGWIEVEADGLRGWISERMVDVASPEEPR